MNTTKPITTISYNSVEYLETRLVDLVKAGMIDRYYFIPHKGEGGDKDHIHMLIIPAKSLDAIWLQKQFNEPDPNNAKPLGVRPFDKCKSEDDFFAYSVHDPVYIELKGETKEFTYKPSDFHSNDEYAEERVKEAVAECTKGFYPLKALTNMMLAGTRVIDLAKGGHINPRDYRALKEMEADLFGTTEQRLMDKVDAQRETIDKMKAEREQILNNQLPTEWRE